MLFISSTKFGATTPTLRMHSATTHCDIRKLTYMKGRLDMGITTTTTKHLCTHGYNFRVV